MRKGESYSSTNFPISRGFLSISREKFFDAGRSLRLPWRSENSRNRNESIPHPYSVGQLHFPVRRHGDIELGLKRFGFFIGM